MIDRPSVRAGLGSDAGHCDGIPAPGLSLQTHPISGHAPSRGLARRMLGAIGMIALVSWLASCGGPADPEEMLREARRAHEVEILSMTRHEGQVLMSLRIIDQGAPLELPCLTLDAVFLDESGAEPVELARRQLEADISDLAEAGGSMDLTWRLEIPEEVASAWQELPPEGQKIEIVLHETSPEGMSALCEAKAIRDRVQ